MYNTASTLFLRIYSPVVLLLLALTDVYGQEIWQPTKSPTGHEVLFLTTQNNTLWAGFGGLGLFYSPDEGETWIEQGDRMLDPFPTALLFEKKHLFVSTLFGGVFRSADGGQTWSSMNTGLGSLHVLCMASLENTLYAGTSQGLYQSDNEGESWQSVQLPYPRGQK